MLINRPSQENEKKAVDVQKGQSTKNNCEQEVASTVLPEDRKSLPPKRSPKLPADRSAIAKAFEESR